MRPNPRDSIPSGATRRRFCLATLAGLSALTLTGCAGLAGPRVIEVPYTKLQTGLERRFPVNQRLLEIFDVELTRPRLQPQRDSERLGLALDAALSSPFMRQTWRGNVALSGRVVLDPVQKAILLAEPRIEQLDLDGLPEARREQVARVLSALTSRVITDLPLYRFRMDELRYAGVQFAPIRLETRADGLALTVEPVR